MTSPLFVTLSVYQIHAITVLEDFGGQAAKWEILSQWWLPQIKAGQP